MKVLVTGGTGFIGKALVQCLLKRNYKVILLCRKPEEAFLYFKKIFNPSSPHRFFLKTYFWDIEKNQAPPDEALEDLKAVIHLAGSSIAQKRWNQRVERKLYDTRIKGTRLLVESLEKKGKEKNQSLQTFLCASAIGYYGMNLKDEKITESFLPKEDKNDFLLRLCVDWENEVKKGWKDLNSPRKVYLRISNVLGPEGGILKKLYPLFKKGLGGRLSSGKQFMSWIHVEDLLRMIVFCLDHDEVEGPINGSAPYPVTNSEFTKLFSQALGKRPFIPVPAFLLFLVAGKFSKYILSSLRVYPDKIQKFGFQFKYPSLKEALKGMF